jgi:Second Messenger Oligonucleotide or Dinucleotide Synthetase domain
MTAQLPDQFKQTLTRIGIERVAAMAAHAEVRVHLETDPKLLSWGVDTILIGSYGRKTSIYPCHDVDVFVELPGCPETNPETAFSEVQRVLVATYGDRAKEQRRSMTVEGFKDDLSVDAVPAVPEGDHWKIPQTDAKPVGEWWVKDRWEETNPERLAELTQALQRNGPKVDGEGAYIRVVRLIRQIRETNLGEAKPGGLYFELLTYSGFVGGVTGEGYAELLAATLEAIARQLESGTVVIEPGMNQPYSPPPDPAAIRAAATTFRRLSSDAARALTLDDCPAALVWRTMFGQNDRGWCFPLPPGCDEIGRKQTPISATPDRGTDAARPFA